MPDSEYKTRRYWLPNASNKKVWSRALGQYIELRIAKGVLRKWTSFGVGVERGEGGMMGVGILDLGWNNVELQSWKSWRERVDEELG